MNDLKIAHFSVLKTTIAFLILMTFSCFRADDTDQPDPQNKADETRLVNQPQVNFNPLLVGSFEGDCTNDVVFGEGIEGPFSVREIFEITPNNTAVARSFVYYQNNCEPWKIVFYKESRFEDLRFIDLSENKVTSSWKLKNISMTLTANEDVLSFFEDSAACGFNSWQPYEAQNITGRQCFGTDIPKEGEVFNDEFNISAMGLEKYISLNLAHLMDKSSPSTVENGAFKYKRTTDLYTGERKLEESPKDSPAEESPLPSSNPQKPIEDVPANKKPPLSTFSGEWKYICEDCGHNIQLGESRFNYYTQYRFNNDSSGSKSLVFYETSALNPSWTITSNFSYEARTDESGGLATDFAWEGNEVTIINDDLIANRESPGSCSDLKPWDDGTPFHQRYSCEQQKEWGHCNKDWMTSNNWCQRTCGQCEPVLVESKLSELMNNQKFCGFDQWQEGKPLVADACDLPFFLAKADSTLYQSMKISSGDSSLLLGLISDDFDGKSAETRPQILDDNRVFTSKPQMLELQLTGTQWESPCYRREVWISEVGRQSVSWLKTSYQFSSDEESGLIKQNIYRDLGGNADNNCQSDSDVQFTYSQDFTMDLDRVYRFSGGRQINHVRFTFGDAKATLIDLFAPGGFRQGRADYLRYFNSQSPCQINNWQYGEEKEIGGRICNEGSPSQTVVPKSGVSSYNIVHFEQNKLYFGPSNIPYESEETRPKQINTNVEFTKRP